MGWRAVAFDAAAEQRIAQAATFERRLRLEAFLNIETDICGIKLRQLTGADILQMEYAENRIADGKQAQLDDYAHLIWLLRPANCKLSEKKYLKKYLPKIRGNEFIQHELDAFFLAAFNDMPQYGGQSAANPQFDSSVWLCSLLDALCSEYGWTIEQALATPLSVAFQMMQRIAKRNNPQYAIRNGITQAAKASEMERLKEHG